MFPVKILNETCMKTQQEKLCFSLSHLMCLLTSPLKLWLGLSVLVHHDTVFYLFCNRKSFWITPDVSLLPFPVVVLLYFCFWFLCRGSCKTLSWGGWGFIKDAEVTVHRKHYCTRHNTAAVQLQTVRQQMQCKWSISNFFKKHFLKWPQKGNEQD